MHQVTTSARAAVTAQWTGTLWLSIQFYSHPSSITAGAAMHTLKIASTCPNPTLHLDTSDPSNGEVYDCNMHLC